MLHDHLIDKQITILVHLKVITNNYLKQKRMHIIMKMIYNRQKDIICSITTVSFPIVYEYVNGDCLPMVLWLVMVRVDFYKLQLFSANPPTPYAYFKRAILVYYVEKQDVKLMGNSSLTFRLLTTIALIQNI